MDGPSANVPTPQLDSPAARALRMEGLKVRELICVTDYAYGQWFTEEWNRRRPFVMVEHDIIPWPGAVEALLECDRPWCSHEYPLQQGHLTTSFGIGKYVPDGPAPADWAETEWRLLDGSVLPEVRKRLGPVHVHEPPVAHARRTE